MQAFTGLVSITGEADRPGGPGGRLADRSRHRHLGGARDPRLPARARATGRGREVDVALFETGLALVGYQSADALRTGVAPGRFGTAFPLIAPYEVFATADGELMIAAANDGSSRSSARRSAGPELADDPRFRTNPDRLANRDELLPRSASGSPSDRRRSGSSRSRVFPSRPCRTSPRRRSTSGARGRHGAGARRPETLGLPLQIDGERVVHSAAAPTLGAQSADVLAELGYSGSEIESLAARASRGSRRFPAVIEVPPEDRLCRPQLPRPRRGAGRRPAGAAAALREVAEHADRLRRSDPHSGDMRRSPTTRPSSVS